MATTTTGTTKSTVSDRAAALAAARRAVVVSPGYRGYVESLGIDPFTAAFEELPFLDKDIVFGNDPLEWAEGGGRDDVVELLTSSGQSGRFSLGLTSRADRSDAQVLTELGRILPGFFGHSRGIFPGGTWVCPTRDRRDWIVERYAP